jgi:hypothetical protein
MNVSIDIKDEALQRAFDGMKVGQLRTAIRSGLRKAMTPVRTAVRREYKSIYKGSKRINLAAIKNYRRGLGVWLGLYKVKPSEQEVQSLIALRSLNAGTVERATRKGYNRGQIKNGSDFFGRCVQASINTAQGHAQREVEQAVIKKAKKEGLV